MVYIDSPEFSPFRTACENDDTALFDEAISSINADELDSYHHQTRRCAIKNNSKSILSHLMQRGVSLKYLRPLDVFGDGHTSKENLELLLVNGWNVNMRYTRKTIGNAKPFMWHVIQDRDMVAWCLEHGASPHTSDPLQDYEPILETVAAWGDVDTFELLRSKGAPFGRRTLHGAVETATYGQPDPIDAEKDTEKDRENRLFHNKRMAMIRHLIHVVRLNMNAPDHLGTPICYIPGSASLERDTRELTWLLLARGADPNPGLEYARLTGYTKFTEDVKAWKAKRDSSRRCCVQ